MSHSTSDTIQVVCPHCLASNRVPRARLFDRPKCGRCHRLLFVGEPVQLDEKGLDLFLARNATPLLVDFWAPWCGPCVQMAPAFATAASTLEPRIRLAKVNTEATEAVGHRFGIRGIPLLILFGKGGEVGRQAGAMSAPKIIEWVRGVLPAAT